MTQNTKSGPRTITRTYPLYLSDPKRLPIKIVPSKDSTKETWVLLKEGDRRGQKEVLIPLGKK